MGQGKSKSKELFFPEFLAQVISNFLKVHKVQVQVESPEDVNSDVSLLTLPFETVRFVLLGPNQERLWTFYGFPQHVYEGSRTSFSDDFQREYGFTTHSAHDVKFMQVEYILPLDLQEDSYIPQSKIRVLGFLDYRGKEKKRLLQEYNWKSQDRPAPDGNGYNIHVFMTAPVEI